MKHTQNTHTGKGRHLSAKEVDGILKDPTSFAEYLSTLTPQEIQEMSDELKSNKEIDKAVAQSFLRILDIALEESKANMKAFEETIVPLADGIAIAQTLNEQLLEMEKLLADLNSSHA